MRFKSFKISKTDEKDEQVAVKEDTVMVTEVADMEEKINNKTKKLKDAEKQLKGLTDATRTPEENEDEVLGPHGPLIELTVEPGNELVDLDTEAELNTLMDTDEKGEEQDINVVEVNNKDAIKVVDKEADKTNDKIVDKTVDGVNETKQKLPKDSKDDFSSLFSEEEEEVNPLSNLISSLPEVSAQELLNQLEEIKGIIQERQQG
jgi:hypothetical protein